VEGAQPTPEKKKKKIYISPLKKEKKVRTIEPSNSGVCVCLSRVLRRAIDVMSLGPAVVSTLWTNLKLNTLTVSSTNWRVGANA
jgi:hypothetical protein